MKLINTNLFIPPLSVWSPWLCFRRSETWFITVSEMHQVGTDPSELKHFGASPSSWSRRAMLSCLFSEQGWWRLAGTRLSEELDEPAVCSTDRNTGLQKTFGILPSAPPLQNTVFNTMFWGWKELRDHPHLEIFIVIVCTCCLGSKGRQGTTVSHLGADRTQMPPLGFLFCSLCLLPPELPAAAKAL